MSDTVKKPKWTNLSELKLMSKDMVDGKEITQRFYISFRGSYPRLHVEYDADLHVDFINLTANAAMDVVMLQNLTDAIVNVTDKKYESYGIKLYNKDWDAVDDPDAVKVTGTVLISDIEGIISLTVKIPNKRTVIFPLLPDPKFFNVFINGIDVTHSSETSYRYAKSFARVLAAVSANYYGAFKVYDI